MHGLTMLSALPTNIWGSHVYLILKVYKPLGCETKFSHAFFMRRCKHHNTRQKVHYDVRYVPVPSLTSRENSLGFGVRFEVKLSCIGNLFDTLLKVE